MLTFAPLFGLNTEYVINANQSIQEEMFCQ